MAGYLHEIPTPFMTFIPQSITPSLPASGTVRLVLDSVDGTLYLQDSAGVLRVLATQSGAHGIDSGNAAHDPVRNANGQLLLSGGG